MDAPGVKKPELGDINAETAMSSICRDIFRAVHEGEMAENRMQEQGGTDYKLLDWNPGNQSDEKNALRRRTASWQVYHRGFPVYLYRFHSFRLDRGRFFCPRNEQLVQDIALNPHKYKPLIDHVANLKILNYPEMCNRMDTVPYYSNFALVRQLDRESFCGEGIS